MKLSEPAGQFSVLFGQIIFTQHPVWIPWTQIVTMTI